MTFDINKNNLHKILCLGAHCDDIEIGCGGTILKLLASVSDLEITWMVFSSSQRRSLEARTSAKKFLANAKEKHILIKDFRDGFFPYSGGDIKDTFEQLKKEYSPDLIFTHYRNDLHQDHRIISELTWNTFRDHLILEYEIPKYDGDLGAPNFFVHLNETICQQKISLITDCFQSQKNREWFTDDTFFSILRLRGIESNAQSKYAEAFYCRKIIGF